MDAQDWQEGEWFIRTRYNGASHGAQELLPVTTLVHVKPEHPLAGSSLETRPGALNPSHCPQSQSTSHPFPQLVQDFNSQLGAPVTSSLPANVPILWIPNQSVISKHKLILIT